MSAANSPDESKAPEKRSNTLLYILLAILALGVIGLVYDRQVARPALERASEDLARAVDASNRSLEDTVTPDDVEEVLGRSAVQSFEDGGDYVEVFAWRSGLPIRTHKLYAIYRDQGGEKVLYRQAIYKYESRGEVIPINELKTIEMTEEEAEAAGNENDEGGGGGGRGGRPGGGEGDQGGGDDGNSDDEAGDNEAGGIDSAEAARREQYSGPPTGTPDPEEQFELADFNDDGLLTETEIVGRMQDNLDEIDTDGDGAISESEYLKFHSQDNSEGEGGSSQDEGADAESDAESEESD